MIEKSRLLLSVCARVSLVYVISDSDEIFFNEGSLKGLEGSFQSGKLLSRKVREWNKVLNSKGRYEVIYELILVEV